MEQRRRLVLERLLQRAEEAVELPPLPQPAADDEPEARLCQIPGGGAVAVRHQPLGQRRRAIPKVRVQFRELAHHAERLRARAADSVGDEVGRPRRRRARTAAPSRILLERARVRAAVAHDQRKARTQPRLGREQRRRRAHRQLGAEVAVELDLDAAGVRAQTDEPEGQPAREAVAAFDKHRQRARLAAVDVLEPQRGAQRRLVGLEAVPRIIVRRGARILRAWHRTKALQLREEAFGPQQRFGRRADEWEPEE